MLKFPLIRVHQLASVQRQSWLRLEPELLWSKHSSYPNTLTGSSTTHVFKENLFSHVTTGYVCGRKKRRIKLSDIFIHCHDDSELSQGSTEKPLIPIAFYTSRTIIHWQTKLVASKHYAIASARTAAHLFQRRTKKGRCTTASAQTDTPQVFYEGISIKQTHANSFSPYKKARNPNDGQSTTSTLFRGKCKDSHPLWLKGGSETDLNATRPTEETEEAYEKYSVVYIIRCKICSPNCIGEIGKMLGTRLHKQNALLDAKKEVFNLGCIFWKPTTDFIYLRQTPLHKVATKEFN